MRHAAASHAFSKQTASPEELLPFEQLLGDGIRPFLSELYMTNGGTLVSYICRRHDENIADIVASSSELAVRPGLLRYAGGAVLDFDWGSPPAVTLPMEFFHQTLTASFKVVFEGDAVGVELLGIQFKESIGDAQERLRRFGEAVADAWIGGGATDASAEALG